MGLFKELKRRNVIRVGLAYMLIGWVLLQGADFGLDLIDAPNWVIQALFMLIAIGLPAVLIFAWVFEMTPEGIKREKDIDRSQSIAPITGHKLDRVIIGILTIAVVVLLLERFRATPEPQVSTVSAVTPPGAPTVSVEPEPSADNRATLPEPVDRDRSIAVLPLANRSINPEDAFFAEGMHDELLTQLSRISALKVISRTSVMGYAGTTKRMPTIGRELGVTTLLEGGVQRAGNRVRINVQLIDASSDEHLWAEVYDRELTADNLFDIQTDITTAIAGALEAVLTGEEKQSLEEKLTDNVEAYGHYLRARANAAVYGREVDGVDESIASYQRAIELDPGFAAAYAAMSIDWSERGWINATATDESRRALEALEHAQALAPNAVETLTAAGYYHYWCNKDYKPAIEAFDQALKKKPGSALALRGRAYALRRMGRLDEALDSFRQVITLDPLHAQMRVDMAFTLMHAGEVLEALENSQKANAIGEPSAFGLGVQANTMIMLGRLDEAWDTLGPLNSNTSGYQLKSFFEIIELSGNAERSALLFEHLDTQDVLVVVPEQSQLTRANILWRQGQSDELGTQLDGIESRLAALSQTTNSAEMSEKIMLSQIWLLALRGDKSRLMTVIDGYLRVARPDAMRPVEDEVQINDALAMVGEFDLALDRIEDVIEQFGPWEFTRYALSPLYDPVRDHPRYQAMIEQHQDWQGSVSP